MALGYNDETRGQKINVWLLLRCLQQQTLHMTGCQNVDY